MSDKEKKLTEAEESKLTDENKLSDEELSNVSGGVAVIKKNKDDSSTAEKAILKK